MTPDPRIGSFYRGSDGAITCAACDCEAEVELCDHCEDGFDGHDCGEDCCCCRYPEDNVPCAYCNGRGSLYICENQDCEATFLERYVEREASDNE